MLMKKFRSQHQSFRIYKTIWSCSFLASEMSWHTWKLWREQYSCVPDLPWRHHTCSTSVGYAPHFRKGWRQPSISTSISKKNNQLVMKSIHLVYLYSWKKGFWGFSRARKASGICSYTHQQANTLKRCTVDTKILEYIFIAKCI